MTCHGNADFHCCWIGGVVCPFLEEGTVPGRRWACGIYRRAGSWDTVYRSLAYRRNVKPMLSAAGLDFDCGDWPQNVPVAMASRSGKCCWQEVSDGDLG